MKKYLSYSLILAAAATGMANAAATAYTSPVGYVTNTLASGQFNIVGLGVHNPTLASGILDAESATSVTDNQIDFTTLLTVGKTYILELSNGTIQEVTTWNAGSLTTQDITSAVTPGTTDYKLRESATISTVFGPTNSAGLAPTSEFDPTQADLVYVPNGTGGFDSYFYSSFASIEPLVTPGWFNASDFTPGNQIPINYADGILVLRRSGAALPLVISGEVKTKPTNYLLAGAGQFNYVGTSFPVGSTLANSGLSSSLTATAEFDPLQADLVYISNGTGGYTQWFYSSFSSSEPLVVPGWFNASDFTPGDNLSLSSGAIILRRGSSTNATLAPPTSYSSL